MGDGELGLGGRGEVALSKIIKELITKMLKRGELYMDQRA